VVALTLRDPAGNSLPGWEPGAHVDLEVRPGLIRQYSLCGDPSEVGRWDIAVLREADGAASAALHDTVTEGDRLRARGPRNNFPLLPAPAYQFIAGGIGVTPIVPMLAAAEAAGAEWSLLYGGRRRASMAFLPELAGYGPRVAVRPQDETGLLDLDGVLGRPRPDTLVYCCGPEPLLAAVEQRCRDWPAGSLHCERFTAGPLEAPARDGPFEVVLARSGRTVCVPPGLSILRAVEEAGVSVLSSCQEGTCGTCETGVLEGEPDHRDSVLTEAERAAGDLMMICVSRSRGSRLVLDL
jgi:ferredoxin-NADP reductase